MKGLILLADFFEDSEAIITIDLLRRAKIDVDLVSIKDTKELTTQSNIKVLADMTIDEIVLDDYEFMILPGGKAVFNTHLESEITKGCIYHFVLENKLVAAICAAPSVLGVMGLLQGKNYVCFPGCENIEFGGNLKTDECVTDGNIITAKAAGSTFMFAHAIIKYLKSKELADQILNQVYYQK